VECNLTGKNIARQRPVNGNHVRWIIWMWFRSKKTKMVGYHAAGEKIWKKSSAILTEYRNVTDRQIDRQTSCNSSPRCSRNRAAKIKRQTYLRISCAYVSAKFEVYATFLFRENRTHGTRDGRHATVDGIAISRECSIIIKCWNT